MASMNFIECNENHHKSKMLNYFLILKYRD